MGPAARARRDQRPTSSGSPSNAERWLSGRKHRTRNAACGQPYRGFESHPLRHATGKIVSSAPCPAKLRRLAGFYRPKRLCGCQLRRHFARPYSLTGQPVSVGGCTVHLCTWSATGKNTRIAGDNRLGARSVGVWRRTGTLVFRDFLPSKPCFPVNRPNRALMSPIRYWARH